jgi:uncharacterized protein (TIGR02246 family)
LNNMPGDTQKIRTLVVRWLEATAAGDVEAVLKLMASDAVFLRPGCAPIRGRKAFAKQTRAALARVRIVGKADIKEIRVEGRLAYCWNRLTITMTPVDGGPAKRFRGDVLSVLKRKPNGEWELFRDANMLVESR